MDQKLRTILPPLWIENNKRSPLWYNRELHGDASLGNMPSFPDRSKIHTAVDLAKIQTM